MCYVCLGSQPGIEPDISKFNLLIECIHPESVNVLCQEHFPIFESVLYLYQLRMQKHFIQSYRGTFAVHASQYVCCFVISIQQEYIT